MKADTLAFVQDVLADLAAPFGVGHRIVMSVPREKNVSERLTKAAFIRGPSNPEDLARVPGTDWVITSGHSAFMPDPQGHLYLINISQRSWEELFPANVDFALDWATYGDVVQPESRIFDAHGLSLRKADDGLHTLYVVNHGGRESVEVFRVDARTSKPVVTWIGAIILPDWCSANDVAPHPHGGFFVTNLCTKIPDNSENLFSGAPSGCVLHWRNKNMSLAIVPGSELNGPNGVEISADGKWCFINSWARREVVKLSLTLDVQEKHILNVDFVPDNLTWTDDRKYLVTTGQMSEARDVFTTYATGKTKIGIPFKVIRIDPDTMMAEELVWYDNPAEFGIASTALIVGDEIWVGTARNDGIAIFQNRT